MESPYNRPKAANLIKKAIDLHYQRLMEPGFCGFSEEMVIFTALRSAGYLTEEAVMPDEN